MKYILSIIIFSILVAGSCRRGFDGPTLVPSSVFFLIRQNGVRLDDATLDNMEMFFFRSGVKNYMTDFQRATEEGHDLGVMTTRNIGTISADEGIKDFYLEYPNGDIDTLFVHYQHLGENAATDHACYCYYPLEQVKYNGVITSPDPAIVQQRVYAFYKP